MAGKWIYPLNPNCPDVKDFHESLFGDPMTKVMGAPVNDICEAFGGKHRIKCKRCQEYGAANVDIQY